ncbi:MAG: cytochrome c [Nitrospirota bacterium]|nr:cytochrome c [Nitrospirota bacterium]
MTLTTRTRMPRMAAIAAAAMLTLSAAACSKSDAPPAGAAGARAIPANGQALFETHCQRCHGERATGTNQGPPLVHKVYEPGHHPDVAFYRAAANGVRAHHWKFGDMPQIGGANTEEVTAIIAYVRGLQREAGIF